MSLWTRAKSLRSLAVLTVGGTLLIGLAGRCGARCRQPVPQRSGLRRAMHHQCRLQLQLDSRGQCLRPQQSGAGGMCTTSSGPDPMQCFCNPGYSPPNCASGACCNSRRELQRHGADHLRGRRPLSGRQHVLHGRELSGLMRQLGRSGMRRLLSAGAGLYGDPVLSGQLSDSPRAGSGMRVRDADRHSYRYGHQHRDDHADRHPVGHADEHGDDHADQCPHGHADEHSGDGGRPV